MDGRLWDDHADWGGAEWLFAVTDDGYAERQIEIYENGPTKRYWPEHDEDQDGGLTYAPFDSDEWEPYRVDAATFERAWAKTDRPGHHFG